jgi:arginyl-tRNA synthetase
LPFQGQADDSGGQSAAGPGVVGARLLLADAVRAVLAAGLSLTGVSARDRM